MEKNRHFNFIYFRKMKQWLLLLIFGCFPFVPAFGIKIKVGVFRGHTIQRVHFTYEVGTYHLFGDSIRIGNLTSKTTIAVQRSGKKVVVYKNGRSLGTFASFYLRPDGKNDAVRLRPLIPALKSRAYNDGFRVFSDGKGLTIVNNVEMSNYLMGVLESEAGGGRPMSYYEAQAVISRTYALKHSDRHEEDGFDVCDQVHCQAYYHKLKYTPDIRTAVLATKGIYVVDSLTGELIQGVFSANCGGETSSADYVWNKDIPYLQPFIDTFCIHTFQAKWTKKIPQSSWRDFLVNDYFYPIDNPYFKAHIYQFNQPHRRAFYLDPALGIPLRDIRYHFRLKSTFFSCHPEGNYVVLNGRGFGHGVGLCQEGAMNMAKYGYNYKEILAFYFSGIQFKQLFEDVYFDQKPSPFLGN